MFQSLTHFCLQDRITSQHQFTILCSPTLEFLYLTNTGMTSLDHISKLQNLHILKIGCNPIASACLRKKLVNLDRLRILCFECHKGDCNCYNEENNALKWFLKSNKSLKQLEFVDFSTSYEIEDGTVKLFVSRHPNWKMISLCDKENCELDYPGIEVVHNDTLKAAYKSLEFYLSNRRTLE